MLRDVLLNHVPTVFRHDLYAVPALLGAGTCLALRLAAIRFGLGLPVARRT